MQVFLFYRNGRFYIYEKEKEDMIYLSNIRTSQTFYVPKDGEDASGALTIQLTSTIDHDVMTFDVVDLNTSDLYYDLSIALPDEMEDGEYEYSLQSGSTTVSAGLMAIGDASSPSQYDKTIEYEQYKSE